MITATFPFKSRPGKIVVLLLGDSQTVTHENQGRVDFRREIDTSAEHCVLAQR